VDRVHVSVDRPGALGPPWNDAGADNYKALNLITTTLDRNVCDHVSHLKIAHDVWLKLCNTYEGSFENKSSHKDTYNR
jgi:hypothetical protein